MVIIRPSYGCYRGSPSPTYFASITSCSYCLSLCWTNESTRVCCIGRCEAEQKMNTMLKQSGTRLAIVRWQGPRAFRAIIALCTSNSGSGRLFSLLIALVLACSFSSCQYPSSAAMSGTWTFSLTSANSPVIIATASLTQSGNQISGPVTLNSGNTACGTQGTISGNIQGTSLTLQIVQLQSQAFLNGTTNQAFTSATGTYTTGGAGTCFGSGAFGSWSAFFQ